MNPEVSIVIPSFNRREMLLRLLNSIKESDYSQNKMEIIIVDNGSKDGTQQAVQEAYPDVILLQQTTNTYSNGARYKGSKHAKGEYLFFIDDDNVLDKACISHLIDAMKRDKTIGICAPAMCYLKAPSKIWCAGGIINLFGKTSYHYGGCTLDEAQKEKEIRKNDFFPNAFLTRTELTKKFELDYKHFPHNWAEPDFSFRVRNAGFALVTVTSAVTFHDIDYQDVITRLSVDKTYDQAKSRLLFRKKYLPGVIPWMAFFLVNFPASTIYYIKKIYEQKQDDRTKIFKAYVRGTIDGLQTKMSRDGVS